MTENRIAVELHTSEYRGDHSADIVIAQEMTEDESVMQLVERVLPKPERKSEWYKHADYLVIRRIRPMEDLEAEKEKT